MSAAYPLITLVICRLRCSLSVGGGGGGGGGGRGEACVGWLGEAKVSCILRNRSVQLILAFSWEMSAILVAGVVG